MITGLVAILVVVAGGLGATLRAVVGNRATVDLPLGTLVVNVAASFLLGVTADLDGRLAPVITIGFLGALSTWSSVANEVLVLIDDARRQAAVGYLAVSVGAGVGAAWLGLSL